MADKPKFELSDITSGTWQKLRAHIEAQIDLYRRKNDGELDATATAKLRGRIAELKALLNTVEPEKPLPRSTDGHRIE